MTEKIYYHDPYLTEAEALIKQVIEKEGVIEAVLDRTIFYPEGGGQPSDTGSINGIAVLHVREEAGVIYHRMESAPEGEKALCRIDWERRFRHMQQHSGEHILSGAFLKLYGGANKGFHMGEDYFTIDIDLKEIREEMLEAVEEEVSRHIYLNSPVLDAMTDKEGLKNHKVRKQVAAEENIRVVTMGDIDCCACCGTHVKHLGEIGLVKILKAEAYKGMTRIYALAGKQAFDDYIRKNRIIKTLKKQLSAEEENITPRVEKLKEEIELLRRELIEQKKMTASEIAAHLDCSEEPLTLLLEAQDFDTLLALAERIGSHCETMILGSGKDGKLLMETRNENLHVGGFFKEHIKNFGGKGGGKGDRAQGSFEKTEDLRRFIEFARDHVLSK